MDIGMVLAVIGIVAVAALAQTVCGFGFAIMVAPPLSLLMEPADAVAATLALLVLACALLVGSEFRMVERAAVGWLLIGALAGLPFGLLALRAASPQTLRVALALAVLASLVAIATGRPKLGAGRGALLVGGWLTGLLTTSVTANGPPTVLAVEGRRLQPEVFRPTVSLVMGLTALIGVAMFAADGRLLDEVLVAVAAGSPALIAGWAIGLALRPAVPYLWFRRAVLALLFVGAMVSLAPLLA